MDLPVVQRQGDQIPCEPISPQSWKKMRELVLRLEADQLWDSINAKDVPPELIQYVEEQIRGRKSPEQIRSSLSIASAQHPAWKKIMSAFNQGYRINGPALISQILSQYSDIGTKLKVIVDDALENGTPAVDNDGRFLIDKQGEPIRVRGPSKELSMIIETWGKNSERFISIAMKTGMLRDPMAQKAGGSGPTTIVVQSNINFPSVEQIRKNQEELAEKAKAIEVKP